MLRYNLHIAKPPGGLRLKPPGGELQRFSNACAGFVVLPPLWGIVATSSLLASKAAHKGRGLRSLFIQMKNALIATKGDDQINAFKIFLAQF